MQSPTAVRGPGAFWIVLAVLVGTLAMLCACEIVQGDSWAQYLRRQEQGALTWDRFVDLARINHRYNNPRWGQLVVVLGAELWVVQLVVTPLAIATLLVASLMLVTGRWPRPRDPRDAWLFVLVIALAMTTAPQLGAIWFYRPNCGNYVYPLAVQLAWLVPYRFLATRPSTAGPLAAPGMLVLGALAGAGNEHTGFAFVLAAAFATCLAWRRDRRVPAWTITGVAGCALGYAFLITAPGQLVRYGHLGEAQPVLDRIAARGVLGNLALPAELVAWLSPSLILLAAAGLPALRRCGPRTRRTALAFCALAAVIVVTALASPKQVARLMFAPSALVAIGIGVVLYEVSQLPPVARRLRIASATIVAVYAAILLCVHLVTSLDGNERLRLLRTAPQRSVAHVPSLTFALPTPFSRGDDFRSARVRDRIANRLGLAAIELR